MIAQVQLEGYKKKGDVFITHTDHQLTHKWVQHNIMHSQFVSDKVRSKVSAIKINEIYHIFFVNQNGQLAYLKRYYNERQQQWIDGLKIIEKDVCQQCYPIVIEAQNLFHLYFLNKNNQTILNRLYKNNLQSQSKIELKSSSSWTKDMKVVKINESSHFICVINESQLAYCILDVSEHGTSQWKTKELADTMLVGAWLSNEHQILLILKGQNDSLYKLIIQLDDLCYKSSQIIAHFDHLQASRQMIDYIKWLNMQQLYYVSNSNQIWRTNLSNNQQSLIFKSNQAIKSILSFEQDNEKNIFFMGQKDFIFRLTQRNQLWIQQKYKPALVWDQIKEYFQPIGDQGYHADAFYSKKLDIIAKKMRNPISYLINNQIKNLDYLSHILNIKCLHQIIHNKVISGLTMLLIHGQKWDNILQKSENIFTRSPIARVLLVLKLRTIIRLLQQNHFCHGDLHLSNILIDIKSQDTLKPQFQIQVIDYGNGFIFKEGELVSKGLTGLEIIIPFEVESICKKNYNPIGINAYQFGRNALQILLLSLHSDVEKLQFYATKELLQLKNRAEYPYELYDMMKGLVDEDPNQRNIWLFKDIDDLEQKTRQIYQSS